MNFANKIKYAYFDMDGTLLSSRDTISPANLAALKLLQKNGIKIGIITGRSNFFVYPHADQTHVDLPVVTMNGALIFDPQHRTLKEKFLPPSAFELINKLIQKKIDFTLYTREGVIGIRGCHFGHYTTLVDRMNKHFQPKYYWSMILRDNWTHENELKVYQITLVFQEMPQAEQDKLLKSLACDDVTFVRSAVRMYNVMNGSVSKGHALRWLADNKFIELDKTMVFGDDYNDMAMFNEVAYPIAMNNGCDELKQKAFMVTNEPNTKDGIAEFILRYWK